MDPYEQIELEVGAGVATITLNRPDRMNAFTQQMGTELLDAFDRTDADDEVRAVIVTGAGRAFCAGADLESAGKTFDYEGPDDPAAHRDFGGRIALRVFASDKPVIAAINGAAVGVGITSMLPADIRVAADSAKLGFVFTRRGIVPEACSSWFLPRIVGISTAAEWMLSGRVFGAQEALDRGLVRSLHPADEVVAEATALAREIADNTAPVSVAMARRLLWRMLGADHPMEAHRADSRAIYLRGKSGDAREGVTAFLEKRDPEFPDRVSGGLPDFFPDYQEPEYY